MLVTKHNYGKLGEQIFFNPLEVVTASYIFLSIMLYRWIRNPKFAHYTILIFSDMVECRALWGEHEQAECV